MADTYVRKDNLNIYAGDDRPFQWPLLDAGGAALEVTGWSAYAQVRDTADPTADLLHTWSTTTGNAFLAAGSVILDVSDSEDWTWTRGQYDLVLVDPQGRHMVLAQGSVRVTPGVSRP